MSDQQPYSCCGAPRAEGHANGCRYSRYDSEGNEKPLTPKRKAEVAAANREADKQAEETFDAPSTDRDDLPDERDEWFRAPGFQRMRLALDSHDQQMMNRVLDAIDREMVNRFADAYFVMNEIFDVIRKQAEEVDPQTGEIKPIFDRYGYRVWAKDEATGSYIEDWELLTYRQREEFLMRITTNLFDWEQRAVTLWTEAMFAKAMFTERFAIEYDSPMTGTIDDRNAVANTKAAEDRYYALMRTSLSRKADALVRTLNNVALRLRDLIQR